MSDHTGNADLGHDSDRAVEPEPVDPAETVQSAESVQSAAAEPSELATVAAAMAAVRAALPAAGGPASVPDDDEVAALAHAHDTLRATLDRAERGG